MYKILKRLLISVYVAYRNKLFVCLCVNAENGKQRNIITFLQLVLARCKFLRQQSTIDIN